MPARVAYLKEGEPHSCAQANLAIFFSRARHTTPRSHEEGTEHVEPGA